MSDRLTVLYHIYNVYVSCDMEETAIEPYNSIGFRITESRYDCSDRQNTASHARQSLRGRSDLPGQTLERMSRCMDSYSVRAGRSCIVILGTNPGPARPRALDSRDLGCATALTQPALRKTPPPPISLIGGGGVRRAPSFCSQRRLRGTANACGSPRRRPTASSPPTRTRNVPVPSGAGQRSGGSAGRLASVGHAAGASALAPAIP